MLLNTASSLVAGPDLASGVAAPAETGSGALMVLSLLLAMVAIAAVANVITSRRQVRKITRTERARAQNMRELLRTVRMAESMAGIGVWQFDPVTGIQQWSDGLKRLFGIEHNDPFVEGDAETLLFANNINLVGKVREHGDEVEPFTLQFDIYGYDGMARSISVQACNLMGSDGKVHRVVAVVRDNTEQMAKVRQLEHSRQRAESEAKKAKVLAETDPLTGLANRRRVMSELSRLLVDARITQMPLVLVMFDIDHFKRVNDTHGHPAGDKVLRKIARIAQGQARDSDLVGRVGGEEFVWVIPAAGDGMARVMTERLRQAIAAESGVDGIPSVTISIGFACIQTGDTALSIFARADGALYEAKHSGRNRVRMAA
ncbi:sensor domain-containing diguanylate cyclase [uncultured Erythrobacter sp.]|uniref:GGDEF domain-containing protein n=1 Tax=uncultured Erythrobacter sp. TaxID=263913 RepID=UPI0026091E4C|nr:sensor domain-containing diguanylate cyclase [uncultured Erythrobacter sp.]